MRKLTLVYRFSAECNSTLGLGDGSLPDPALSASSAHAGHEADKARLHRDGGWLARYKAGQWLQVALNSVTNITAITTQGHSRYYTYWTSLYRLESRLDGNDWKPYRKVRGIFRGSYHYPQALPLTKADPRSANNMRDQQTRHRKSRVVAMVTWSEALVHHKLVSGNMSCYRHSKGNQ